MRFSEILNLVRINLIQNKFKVLLTSIGIIVGAATIVCVIAIGRGGQADVADQFRNLNAGALDISYEKAESTSGFSFGGGSLPSFSGGSMPGFSGGNMPSFSATAGKESGSSDGSSKRSSRSGSSGMPSFDGGSMPSFGGSGSMPDLSSMFGGSTGTKNREKITLSTEDMEDITASVPGLSEATITYTTKQNIYGGNIEETESYTIAGTLSDYAELSNLSMFFGDYLSDADNENKTKVCVLGYAAAKSIFGSTEVLRLFTKLHEMGNTIVMITHDMNVAKWAERTVNIVDGQMYQ